MKRFVSIIGLAGLVTVIGLSALIGQQHFDHETHANLFPVCTGCHAGILSGDSAAWYPRATECARCHDGKRVEPVKWSPPQRLASNLRFAHDVHQADTTLSCATCHAKNRSTRWMSVARAQAETCLGCHDSKVKQGAPVSHLATETICIECHVPLRNANRLSARQIAALPTPPSHKAAGFVREHKTVAQKATTCSVCHTQESCARCHVNATSIKTIVALGSNPNVSAAIAGKRPVYPKPIDHTGSFARTHGERAQVGLETCSNCHTRESCQECHRGNSAADEIARLPERIAGNAYGVDLKASGRNVHPAGFATAHGIRAGAEGETCSSCHAQKFCSDCHQAPDSKKFHPPNFASRHSESVYTGDSDCVSCHSREGFCQSCHTGLGLNSMGKRASPFHTGQSIWLLQHGQPARQSLESCTSCHTQSSCTRCHATNSRGGWGVSPHGSMSSAALRNKNQVACLRCHG